MRSGACGGWGLCCDLPYQSAGLSRCSSASKQVAALQQAASVWAAAGWLCRYKAHGRHYSGPSQRAHMLPVARMTTTALLLSTLPISMHAANHAPDPTALLPLTLPQAVPGGHRRRRPRAGGAGRAHLQGVHYVLCFLFIAWALMCCVSCFLANCGL